MMHAAAMLQKTQASPRVCWHLFCRSLRSFQMSNRQLLAGHTMPRTPHVDEHHSFMCFAGISEGLQNAKDRMHVLQLVLQLFVSLQRVLWQLPESCNRLLRKHFRSSTAGALWSLREPRPVDFHPNSAVPLMIKIYDQNFHARVFPA